MFLFSYKGNQWASIQITAELTHGTVCAARDCFVCLCTANNMGLIQITHIVEMLVENNK